MNNHFINTIEINNFKCFHNFKAEGLGRVNLIGGKNNVGKTSFMEACYINIMAMNIKSFVGSLQSIKYMRENLNILENRLIDDTKKFVEQTNNISVSSNINNAHFNIDENEGIKKYHFEFNKQIIDVNANEFSYDLNLIHNIVFIDNFGFGNSQIKDAYLSIQKKDKEQFLNDILHTFDNRIEKIIAGDIPQCRVNGVWLDLTELGDGARHLVSIITSLFKCENGYLFIDELDNGIHYTQLDELWEIILKVSKEQNVQVFATTHSKECIESFNRIQQKFDDKDTYYFEFYQSKKTNQINVKKRDKEQLEYSLSHNGEFRGE
ncbi:MAG: AAA family ATPase [Sulfuricurvum sp.]|uniref:AAA family ATPase n=1 Tax=Sulfuricurvum sp. TaxID=2025608 RepID=UPI0026018913|nr:AAA family ATPase [Sulfuricurvum sp.]MDD2829711.1 AAA family ATPase [Sulfuricurvum sp.]MDD4950153.1 AAA family ATPase [Sulfuricurvum sp.]